MNLRDSLSLLGAILIPLGTVFTKAGTNSTLWWIGTSFVAVGPVLIAARAVIKDPTK